MYGSVCDGAKYRYFAWCIASLIVDRVSEVKKRWSERDSLNLPFSLVRETLWHRLWKSKRVAILPGV